MDQIITDETPNERQGYCRYNTCSRQGKPYSSRVEYFLPAKYASCVSTIRCQQRRASQGRKDLRAPFNHYACDNPRQERPDQRNSYNASRHGINQQGPNTHHRKTRTNNRWFDGTSPNPATRIVLNHDIANRGADADSHARNIHVFYARSPWCQVANDDEPAAIVDVRH